MPNSITTLPQGLAQFSGGPFVASKLYLIRSFLLIVAFLLTSVPIAVAQGQGSTLFGDIKVDESKVEGMTPLSFNIILYTLNGTVAGRQAVAAGGRYRFINLRSGEYDLAVEVENKEIARVRILHGGSPGTEIRQDLELEWRATNTGKKPKAQTISAADIYERGDSNKSLFEKAQSAIDRKKYSDAAALLQELLAADPKDFQAWTEMGNVYLLQDKPGDAERAYQHALEERPAFALALLNLGRALVAQKKFEQAITPLTQAVELRRDSADANFLLGEAFLQIKKGSKAVPHLNEAARLGQVDAHLRLAALYNAAGLKSQAASEYEQFLKKKPDYPGRKKLEQYITEQKKP